MKKVAILIMTSFYLSLTTGMFICIVHCAAETLFEKQGMQMARSNKSHQNKHCTSGKDCDCCRKHTNYTIKENIKPGYEYGFLKTIVLLNSAEIPHRLMINHLQVYNSAIFSNAPPWKSGKDIAIQYHSLQI